MLDHDDPVALGARVIHRVEEDLRTGRPVEVVEAQYHRAVRHIEGLPVDHDLAEEVAVYVALKLIDAEDAGGTVGCATDRIVR